MDDSWDWDEGWRQRRGLQPKALHYIEQILNQAWYTRHSQWPCDALFKFPQDPAEQHPFKLCIINKSLSLRSLGVFFHDRSMAKSIHNPFLFFQGSFYFMADIASVRAKNSLYALSDISDSLNPARISKHQTGANLNSCQQWTSASVPLHRGWFAPID